MDWWFHTFEDVASTQDSVKNLIKNPLENAQGICVQALRQSQGRGRHGRVWHDGAGNLMMSFSLKPECDLSRLGEISLLCGLSVAKTLVQMIDKEKIILKWPNDVLVEGRKISGLLIEVEGEYLVIGLGVNIAVAPYENSICLADIATPCKAQEMRDRVLAQFENLYAQWKAKGFEVIREEWLSFAPPKSSPITVKMPSGTVEGQFETIDGHANLVIRDSASRLVRVSSGDVYL